MPDRVFASPADFNTQLQAWLVRANHRQHRVLGCRPADRIEADTAAMLTLPPVGPSIGWRTSTRLPRDHYVRLDGNDYSVHPAAELAYLTRALKAPTLRGAIEQLADRARTKTWSYEEFLAACLQREVSARESHGGEGRIRAARFPSRKSLEEFDFDHARGLKRDTIAHLGTLDFVTLAIGIAIRACQAGHRVLFATASQWVDRLAAAHHSGTLQSELIRLARYPLLVVDEVGYIPFEPEAANLFFQLVSSRYERASLIVTSNKPFGRWGEVFGDDVVAAAMIDRLVHHAEVIALKGDSYRIKDRDLGRVPTVTADDQ